MENGMNKIQLQFNQHTKADEVLDQITFSRLKQIRDVLECWDYPEDKKVIDACQTLIGWMESPHAED
jgi:hypothetical protein